MNPVQRKIILRRELSLTFTKQNFRVRGFITIIFLLSALLLNAKSLSHGNISGDTLRKDSVVKPKVHSPKKAMIMSACLPGLGQVYNKQWWKAPVIYAGFGGLGYAFWWNNGQMKIYKDALHARYDNDPNTVDPFPLYSDDNLVSEKNYYQRYRDLSVIGMSALYILNILDAAVYAHLWNFDVSDDLLLNVTPGMMPCGRMNVPVIGLRLGWK